jgi:hypothetical protein
MVASERDRDWLSHSEGFRVDAPGETITVEVADARACADLARALAVKGLPVRVAPGSTQLSVASPHERTERLLRDLLPAVDQWRREMEAGPVQVAVGGVSFTIRDRSDVERALAAPAPA